MRRDKKRERAKVWSSESIEWSILSSLASLEKRASCNSHSALSLSLCVALHLPEMFTPVLKSDTRGERRFGHGRRERERESESGSNPDAGLTDWGWIGRDLIAVKSIQGIILKTLQL